MGKFVALVIGAAAGFAAGILLAPKSGKETREEIMRKKQEYKGKAQAGLVEVKKGAAVVGNELSESADAIKDIAADAAGGVKRTANRVKEEATNRAKVISGEVQQTAADTRRAAR